MKKFELAIAGGGLTAARAIKSYREAGGGGQVAPFSEEATLPYHRPALSPSDIVRSPYSCSFDSQLTMVDDRLVTRRSADRSRSSQARNRQRPRGPHETARTAGASPSGA